MSDEEREKLEQFLTELRDLCGRYGYKIGGCGCCGSPWLVTESRYDVHSLSASGDGASVWCAGEEIPDER